jgi:outer membrane protein OmpA-like peptidoglycan-associated protein
MVGMGQSIIAAAPKDGFSASDTGWLQAEAPEAEKPANEKVRVTEDALVIDGTIKFPTNSMEMKPSSYELLGSIAATLNTCHHIKKLEVQGHSDNRGDQLGNLNLKLSQMRADTVREWLVTNGGVDGRRLTSRGYGATKPILSANNNLAHSTNRRVEFVILERQLA